MNSLTIKQFIKLTFNTFCLLVVFALLNPVLASDAVAQKLSKTKVDLSVKEASLIDILEDIEEQTAFNFVYDRKVNRLKNRFNFDLKGASLRFVLETLAKDGKLKFKRINENISINVAPKDNKVVEIIYQDVSGTVTDADGNPLPGASIVEKGTNNGTTTDFDGNFSISVSSGDAVLIVSYIGFEIKEVPVNNQSQISVQLTEKGTSLDEVVVVGYGTTTRRQNTGSISSISAEEIGALPINTFEQAIAGRASGVLVQQNSGAPGGSVSVRIRGVGTPGNSEPLYVIDGIILNNDNTGGTSNILSTINPNDIESIDILKDAASASIYGARAANGVVLITTKSGKLGKTKLNLDYYVGVQNRWNEVDVLSGPEYASYVNELTGANTLDPNQVVNSDWQDALYQSAVVSNLNIGLNGGNENSTYSLSAGYFDQEGIILGSDFERISVRANSKHNLRDWLRIGNSFSVSRSERNGVSENAINNGVLGIALQYSPVIPVFDADGNFGGPGDVPGGVSNSPRANPLALAELSTNETQTLRALGNLYFEVDPFPGLTYRLNLANDFIYNGNNSFVPNFTTGTNNVGPNPRASRFDQSSNSWIIENTLQYNFDLDSKHYFKLLAGATRQGFKQESQLSNTTTILDDNLIYLNAQDQVVGNSFAEEWGIQSYFGRLNYNYDGKYLFSASVRHDGSSRFAPNERFGTFPSVSAGWIVSSESFLEDSKTLSFLKLKGSWGVLGNDQIPLYSFVSQVGNVAYVFGDGAQGGTIPNTLANTDLTWEETTQFDLGIETEFFDGKLNFSLEYYNRNTEDILLRSPLPLFSGIPSSGTPFINAGEVNNNGIEVQVGYREDKGDFKWSLSGNLTTINNEVTSLNNGQELTATAENIFVSKFSEGQQVGAFFGYQTDGIFQTAQEVTSYTSSNGTVIQPNAQPGDFRYKDLNDDGTISADDQTFIGNPVPKFVYGISGSASYKNFDFSILLQGVEDVDVFNQNMFILGDLTFVDANHYSDIYNNRWTGPGTSNTVPAANLSSVNNNTRVSDYYVFDSSYLRLKNVSVGYTIPAKVTDKWGIERFRIYISGQNLLTFTGYDLGQDPEIGADGQNPLLQGYDAGRYPLARVIQTGLSFNF
ncbi:SusC/RagA family TonB-linked outer membrane protein [Maribacter sp. 2304DJ31-5]|uniref:SusC/RagA family TonB-linked outer membrane protein n=1 Tax=Maribacter sp. 2304DJ31-5 TaxID=3386273 RepID=UPI0039BC7F48